MVLKIRAKGVERLRADRLIISPRGLGSFLRRTEHELITGKGSNCCSGPIIKIIRIIKVFFFFLKKYHIPIHVKYTGFFFLFKLKTPKP